MANNTIDLKALLMKKTENMEPAEKAKENVAAAEAQIPRNLMYDAESTNFKPEQVFTSEVHKLTVDQAKEQDAEMTKFVEEALVSGVDYGVVPKTSKPSLLKPGAEKLMRFMGLIPRTVITNRTEDYQDGFFSYECKVYLLDGRGTVRAEGIASCNTREPKYIKSSGFASMNTCLKMSKKRALIDAVLNVAAISSHFTQDVEDMNVETDVPVGRNPEELRQSSNTPRPATQKQIAYLERLMQEHNTSATAMNRFTMEHWAIEDYHKITGVQASELIEKFKAVGA